MRKRLLLSVNIHERQKYGESLPLYHFRNMCIYLSSAATIGTQLFLLYSNVPNKRTVLNKCTDATKMEKQINVPAVLLDNI